MQNFKLVVGSWEFMPSGSVEDLAFEYWSNLLGHKTDSCPQNNSSFGEHKPLFSLVPQWSWSSPGSSGWTLVGGHFDPAPWQKPLRGCICPQCLQLSHRNYILTSLQRLKRPRAACKWCRTWGEWETWNSQQSKDFIQNNNVVNITDAV